MLSQLKIKISPFQVKLYFYIDIIVKIRIPTNYLPYYRFENSDMLDYTPIL